MKPTAPLSLHLFVISLGVAIQFVAGMLALQADNPMLGLAISLGAVVIVLAYAVQVSYRRGFEASRSNGHSGHDLTKEPQSPAN
jgi:hypothetical protein